MTLERRNEAVVRRFYDELWNEWRLDLADEILSEEIHFRGSLGTVCDGREAFKAYAENVRVAFPDWYNRVDEILAADDRVVTRMTWTGTHRGPVEDLKPTGAQVEYPGAAFFHLSNGLIEEAWVVGDTQELWHSSRMASRADGRMELRNLDSDHRPEGNLGHDAYLVFARLARLAR